MLLLPLLAVLIFLLFLFEVGELLLHLLRLNLRFLLVFMLLFELSLLLILFFLGYEIVSCLLGLLINFIIEVFKIIVDLPPKVFFLVLFGFFSLRKVRLRTQYFW